MARGAEPRAAVTRAVFGRRSSIFFDSYVLLLMLLLTPARRVMIAHTIWPCSSKLLQVGRVRVG